MLLIIIWYFFHNYFGLNIQKLASASAL